MARKLSRFGELFFLFAMFLFAIPISDLLLDLFHVSSLTAAFVSIILILFFSMVFYNKVLMIDRIFITILSIRHLKEFVFLVMLLYGMLITAFATFYYCVDRIYHPASSYFKWFYFSVITMTTVGYGDVVPINGWMQLLVSLESFIGYVSLPIFFSIGLGLILDGKKR
ncbi:MAG: ion channel [Dehalobacterium sp.]